MKYNLMCINFDEQQANEDLSDILLYKPKAEEIKTEMSKFVEEIK